MHLWGYFWSYNPILFSKHTLKGITAPGSSRDFADANRHVPVKILIASTLPILAGIGYTASTLLLKKCPYLTENSTRVLFWSFIFGTLLSVIPMAAFETPTFPSKWPDVLFVFGHCSSFVIGWISALYAVQCISGNVINFITSTSVVLLLIPQYTVLSSVLPGHRNWMEVVGVVLILLGSVMGSVIEMCK